MATATVILFVFLTFLFSNIVMVYSSLGYLLDFGSFIASGQEAAAGRNPYTADSPLIFRPVFTAIGMTGVTPNLNPPVSVLFFRSAADLDMLKAVNLWRLVSGLIFVLSIYILARAYPHKSVQHRIAWAFSLAGFWHTIQLGQIYMPLLLAAAGAWILLERGHFKSAGVLLGILIAIKPNFVFWAFLLFMTGCRVTFLTAGLTSLAISLPPLFAYGPEIYKQWLEAASAYTPGVMQFPGNNSLQGLMARFGVPEAGTALGLALAIFILLRYFRNVPSMSRINATGILTSLLISPIAWTGYTILTLPILFAKKEWLWHHWIAAFIFAFPFLFIIPLFQMSGFGFAFFGWFYGWGLLILLMDALFENSQPIS